MMTLSLITITFNTAKVLKKTIVSVQKQTPKNLKIEHIIVDNMSSDDTQKIVTKYQKSSNYPVIYIHEPDTGRYNGMNKGVVKATGDYLLFLNAGDCLHNQTVLSRVAPELNADIVYGDISGKSLKDYKIDRQFFLDRTLFHQATFIKKELFKQYGLYDENLVISGDFDFFIRAIIKYHVSTKYLPLTITDYDPNGISSQQSDLVYQERAQVITRYYPGKDYLHNFIKYIYYKNKQYFPKFLINYQKQHLTAKPKI